MEQHIKTRSRHSRVYLFIYSLCKPHWNVCGLWSTENTALLKKFSSCIKRFLREQAKSLLWGNKREYLVIYKEDFSSIWLCTCTEAEFVDEIRTKVSRVFLLAIHSHLYSFALRFKFLQTHATSYVHCTVTVHCKGERRKT